MSAQHGTPSLVPPAAVPVDEMQLDVELINAGSSSSFSLPTDTPRNNSVLTLQGNNEPAQRVLNESFCVTRLQEIRQLAQDFELKNFDGSSTRVRREKAIERLFKRFRRENGEGEPPYFCVSAALVGRILHTLKEEYITNDLERHASEQLTAHVESTLDLSRQSITQEAEAFRIRTQEAIERQQQLIEAANQQAAMALEANHARLRETLSDYGKALDNQLQTVLQSTITEDTLTQEMAHAEQTHRARIRGMTFAPPLQLEEGNDILELQLRNAFLDQQSEDLNEEFNSLRVDRQFAEAKSARLQKMVDDLQKAKEEQADIVEVLTRENARLQGETAGLQLKAVEEKEKVTRTMRIHERHAEVSQKHTRGLTDRLEKAQGELERLKRKRKDSASPPRVITEILKRPGTSPPSAAKADTSPAPSQPPPKKSRNRKARWNDPPTGPLQDLNPFVPLTSSNQDGGKERKGQSSSTKRRDPVLYNPPSSARRKNDIITEIEESAKTLSLTRQDFSFVFHRSNVDDQVLVTKKALSYVESIVTATCEHLLKGVRPKGNPVKAYLETLPIPVVEDLLKEVDAALEQCEDSRKHMAVYRCGDDLARRVRAQCFNGGPLRPHKATDTLRSLHNRLGCHSQHHIPIGFYYAKWSEKMHSHLKREMALKSLPPYLSPVKSLPPYPSSSSSRSRTPSPKKLPEARLIKKATPKTAASPAAIEMSIDTAEDNINELRMKRAAIFDETKDGMLRRDSAQGRAVFWYRENRRLKWQAAASETMLNESEWKDQYDREELEKLGFLEEQLETLLGEHLKSIGDGPAGQESN